MGAMLLTNGTITVRTAEANAVCGTLVEQANELLDVARKLGDGPEVERIVEISNALVDRARTFNTAVHGCNPPRPA